MNEAKFSKGPWKAVKGEDGKPNKIYHEYVDKYAGREYTKQGIIATLPAHNGCLHQKDDANLALIAAAPDMYDLLWQIKGALEYCRYEKAISYDLEHEIGKLLKKARGEDVDESGRIS